MLDQIPWLSIEIIKLLLNGLLVTLVLTLITSSLALAAGVMIGWLRLSGSPLVRWLATGYTEIFRNIPALVAVLFWAYALPNAFGPDVRRMLFFDNSIMDVLKSITGLSIPYYAVGVAIGLTMNTSAYIAELFRAGVSTLDSEHWEAARSLGATRAYSFRHLMLPGGLRAAKPGLVNRLVHNMKNTALASFVTVPEFFKMVETSINRTFYAVELLLVATVVYWLLSWAYTVLLERILPGQQRSRSMVG